MLDVIESENPIAISKPKTIFLDALGSAQITVSDVNDGSSDNCGIDTLTLDKAVFGCIDVGSNNVTLEVKDDSGNTSTSIATVTVIDTISPIPHTKPTTVYLNAAGQVSISPEQINNNSSDVCGISNLTLDRDMFDCNALGGQQVVLSVVDNNGNSATASATVTVVDTIRPISICKNLTIYLDASGQASIDPSDVNGGSNDACGVTALSLDKKEFSCSDIGANNIKLEVTDGSGNKSICTAMVTVLDTIHPAAKSNPLTIYLDASGSADISVSDVNDGSTDNCSIDTMTIDKSVFSCADIGPNNVTLEVTDGSGSSSTAIAVVTVVDTISPTVQTKPATVYLDAAGQVSIMPADINDNSGDVCGISNLTINRDVFNCDELGEQQVVLSVLDNNGNISTAFATVTVVDTISPIVICKNLTVYLDASGQALISPLNINEGSSDACDVSTLSLDQEQFSCSDVGANDVTLEVTDGSGNKSFCISVVTVRDTISPIPNTKSATVYLDATGVGTLSVADVNNNSLDPCGISNLSIDKQQFNCDQIGEQEVILTAIDENGNSSSAVATVIVRDTISPIASCKNITITLDVEGQASITASDINDGSQDICGAVALTISKSDFTCADLGTNQVSLEVTDFHGNQSSCFATVTVEDGLNPNTILDDQFISGPTMLCPNNKDVVYTADTKGLSGSVVWSYTGSGVTITPSSNTLSCSLDFSDTATAGDLVGTFQGVCQAKTAVFPIDIADPLRCSLFSNCALFIFMSPADLDRSDVPDFIQSQTRISVSGVANSGMMMFMAGESIEFRENFEVSLGASISAEVETCSRSNP